MSGRLGRSASKSEEKKSKEKKRGATRATWHTHYHTHSHQNGAHLISLHRHLGTPRQGLLSRSHWEGHARTGREETGRDHVRANIHVPTYISGFLLSGRVVAGGRDGWQGGAKLTVTGAARWGVVLGDSGPRQQRHLAADAARPVRESSSLSTRYILYFLYYL